MTRVVLIRPGATLYDEQNRVQGVLDLPLSDRGRAEALLLADSLRALDLDVLYCGPGESVAATAEVVARAVGVRPRRVEDLRNLDHGLWQGLQVDEIRRRNPKVFRQWLDEPRTICPPNGETVDDAQERLRSSLRPLLKRHRDQTIGLIVADPLARLVSCYLRREPELTLDESPPTGTFEDIEVPPDVYRNGDGH